MVVIGIDPHKRSHTAVAVDEASRKLGQLTVNADDEGFLRLWAWAARYGTERRCSVRWAVEDGRGVAGRLARGLIGQGAAVVWVPPKLMAQCRASARTRGKSDPIDALAIARAAIREPDLPAVQLDQTAAELRLLSDRREHLVTSRTRADQPAALAPARPRPSARRGHTQADRAPDAEETRLGVGRAACQREPRHRRRPGHRHHPAR